jgi:hypothetical protein
MFFVFNCTAGTISLAWDPVVHLTLTGYKIYWGTSAGNYQNVQQVGLVTAANITVPDCQNIFVALKATATGANNTILESLTYSNELSGWARPMILSVNYPTVPVGWTGNLVIEGNNFKAGGTVEFQGSNIVINSVTVNSCARVTINITIPSSEATGLKAFHFKNPDTTWSGWIVESFGIEPRISAPFNLNVK